MSSTTRILLTGATGYVGGTVLDKLIESQEPSIKALTFDLLVRTEDAAAKLREAYGSDRVNPILWPGGLTNIDFITETAANYDLIINTGTGFIPDGAKAFVNGLARRLKPGHPPPWLLHISGCTNLADRPLTQKAYPDREWDDADAAAAYEFMKNEDAVDPYPQRTTEVVVLTAGEETGVQVVSLNTPCIFGEGKGLFNRAGLVIPIAMRYVVEHGYGFKLNDTANFDWVHIEDLADAYVLLTRTILEREDRGVGYIPSGKNGLIFPTVGRVLQTDIIQRCLDVAFDAGILPREGTPSGKEIRQLSLQDAADEMTAGLPSVAERGLGGNKAQNGTMAKKLFGWGPKHLEDAWNKDFVDELDALKDGRRGITMDNCVGKA